jgi:hypothetical protein
VSRDLLAMVAGMSWLAVDGEGERWSMTSKRVCPGG